MTANRLTSVVTLLFLIAAQTPSSSQQSGSDRTPVARMVLRVLATPDNGPAFERASSDVDLAPGQSGSATFATSPDLCASTMRGPSAPDRTASLRHAWTVRFTLISAQTDRIAVDVDIERRDDGRPGARHVLRHLVLPEGAPHVIDFIQRDDDRSCATANLVIEMSATMIESAPFARQVLGYDVWLTHRDPSGREWVRHETRTATQGERVDVRFAPLAWSTRTIMPSLGIDQTIDEHILGSIRARLEPNGQVQVSLTASRRLVGGNGSTGDGMGVKVFTARAGEAVSVQLPAVGGQTRATSADGSRLLLDYGELFKGHTTAITLVVKAVN